MVSGALDACMHACSALPSRLAVRGRRSSIDRRAVSLWSLLQCKCAPAESDACFVHSELWPLMHAPRQGIFSGCAGSNACNATVVLVPHLCMGRGGRLYAFAFFDWRWALAPHALPYRSTLCCCLRPQPFACCMPLGSPDQLCRPAVLGWGHGWKQAEKRCRKGACIVQHTCIAHLHSTRRSACM